MSTSNLALAHQYAAAGRHVIAVGHARKVPLVSAWPHAATTDHDQINAWWREHPRALVGLVTADIAVLDIDVPSDCSREALAAIIEPYGIARAAWDARMIGQSPRRGAHLYFLRQCGVAFATRAGDIGPAIDTRGHTADGTPTGVILAPGNVRPDGGTYRIVHGSFDEIGAAPMSLTFSAMFSARERHTIRRSEALQQQIREAAPDCWRELFDENAETAFITQLARAPMLTADIKAPMREQAKADLQDAADCLAGTIDGRKGAIFKAAAAVGKYLAGGVLNETEITTALMTAWADCGALTKHGARYGQQQIAAGLKVSRNDPLPPLARKFMPQR
jgi:Bifunctional DNA primase/polymerase, N-terminal